MFGFFNNSCWKFVVSSNASSVVSFFTIILPDRSWHASVRVCFHELFIALERFFLGNFPCSYIWSPAFPCLVASKSSHTPVCPGNRFAACVDAGSPSNYTTSCAWCELKAGSLFAFKGVMLSYSPRATAHCSKLYPIASPCLLHQVGSVTIPREASRTHKDILAERVR